MSKEKICGIYCIENLINSKKYIGLSTNIDRRLKDHKNNLRKNKHVNGHLQSAWNTYGEKNFKFFILEVCDEDRLAKREIYYIDKFKSRDRVFGYNKTSGGDGIKDLDVECANKISISETLYPVIRLNLSGEFICEYRNCRVAADSVDGQTENIRACCDKKRGRKTAYNSIWMYKFDYEQNGCDLTNYKLFKNLCKPIIQYDLQMNYVAEYESAHDADRATGIGYKMISRVCNYQRPHTHGYIFRFKNDVTIQN